MEFESYGDVLSYLLRRFRGKDNMGIPITDTLSEKGKLYQFTIKIEEVKT